METISNYLESGKYPEGLSKSQKRDFRKRAADFTFQDGILHYVGSRKKSAIPRQVILDTETQQPLGVLIKLLSP